MTAQLNAEPVDAARATEEAVRLWDDILNNRISVIRITDGQLGLLERQLPADHEARYGVTPGDPDCETRLAQLRNIRDAELRKMAARQNITHPQQVEVQDGRWQRRKIARKTGTVELVIFKLTDPPEGQGNPVFDWAQMPTGRGHRARYAGMLAARVVTQRFDYHRMALDREQKEEDGYSQVALAELWKRADLRRDEIVPADDNQ